MQQDTLRAVIYEGEQGLVAQCLEKDIVATVVGDNVIELIEDFTFQVELNRDVDIPPAPEKFFTLWEAGEKLAQDDSHLQLRKVA